MAYTDNISRLSRLTAIHLKLQSNLYVTVEQLSEQFNISKRTVYRDLHALEQANVPIVTVEGKGYTLMDGYKIPPVMFTETEANALIFAQKIMAKTKDESLINEFNNAIDKVKAVLRSEEKSKADFLANRTFIGKNWQNEKTSNFLSVVQRALTNFNVLKIDYKKESDVEPILREIEPFAIYHSFSEDWIVVAWCRLRNEFRNFRIDRIKTIVSLPEKFVPHHMTMEEYGEIQRKKYLEGNSLHYKNIKTTKMITVKVTYTVKPDFVQKNQENINLFMTDFKKMDTNEFRYGSYVCGDGKTFVHLSHYKNENIQKKLLQVPSFLSFQKQRDESGLEDLPEIEVMEVIASSHDIFKF
ncbi:helix-turn-helix transcriptional regulator [Algibacter pacificus]|uniref:helix-turn-helix transcriptional regulator n=1 Tax=Algibacter pacificus TaxID=2599389 RepID=UPI0011CB06B0|nr:YafY family protein [Algibacter pacificus]